MGIALCADSSTGADASANSESSLLIDQTTPFGWQNWDLTAVSQRWINGTSQNCGVLLWTDSEDVRGYDLRFHSSRTASVRAQVVSSNLASPCAPDGSSGNFYA